MTRRLETNLNRAGIELSGSVFAEGQMNYFIRGREHDGYFSETMLEYIATAKRYGRIRGTVLA